MSSPYEDALHGEYDSRVATLGRIKAKSIGADELTLRALQILVYAQLEGGVKSLSAILLKDLNRRRLPVGLINPTILSWRNKNDLSRFKAAVNFSMVAISSPFGPLLARTEKVKSINRKYELNQMGWSSLATIYSGLDLDISSITAHRQTIEEIVEERNNAAHHGTWTPKSLTLLENQLRSNVDAVESVLTDFSINLLGFFIGNKHLR